MVVVVVSPESGVQQDMFQVPVTNEYMVALMYESTSMLYAEWVEQFRTGNKMDEDYHEIENFMEGWYMSGDAIEIARRVYQRLSDEEKEMILKLQQNMLEIGTQNLVISFILVRMALVLETFGGLVEKRMHDVLNMLKAVGGRDFLQRGEFTERRMVNVQEVKRIERRLLRRRGRR